MMSGQDQMSTSSRSHGPTKDDAVANVKKVKDSFQDNKEKYYHFLEILKDYQAGRVDISDVILRVKDLFEGHRHLILGFNFFLPEGYQITLPEDREGDIFLRTVCFCHKVEIRLGDRENLFIDFLDILKSFRNGNVTAVEVRQKVLGLLRSHTDLVEEFMDFLSDENCC